MNMTVKAEKAAATGETESRTSREDVIDAAIRCFERYGPQRTSMSDIAEEAGISRKTLYRIFNDRHELVQHTLMKLLRSTEQKSRRALEAFSTVKDAFIEGSIACVSIGRKEKLVYDIIEHDTDYHVDHFLVRGDTEFRKDMLRLWHPYIEQGRKEGLIRPDLSDLRIAELLLNVHSLLSMRDDKNEQISALSSMTSSGPPLPTSRFRFGCVNRNRGVVRRMQTGLCYPQAMLY